MPQAEPLQRPGTRRRDAAPAHLATRHAATLHKEGEKALSRATQRGDSPGDARADHHDIDLAKPLAHDFVPGTRRIVRFAHAIRPMRKRARASPITR